MVVEDSFLVMLLKYSWAGFLAVFGWMGKGMYAELKKLREDDNQHRTDIASLRLHISENYPTKSDLNAARIETKDSVDRLHHRLDGVAEDIKTILKNTKR